MILKDLASAVTAVLPERLGEDVRRNVHAAVRAGFENMELVSREELDVQRQVLQRTRSKVEALESRVAELERRLAAQPSSPDAD